MVGWLDSVNTEVRWRYTMSAFSDIYSPRFL